LDFGQTVHPYSIFGRSVPLKAVKKKNHPEYLISFAAVGEYTE
jgi:hypothetical protein